MRWAWRVALLVGCAHHGGAGRGGAHQLTASLQARPGKWCSSVYVTSEGKVLRGERGGCRIELGFELDPVSEQVIRLPAPDDRSGPYFGTLRGDRVLRRWVSIAAPVSRTKPWQVRLLDEEVSTSATAQREALAYDLRPHRLIAVEVTDVDRYSQSPMPFEYGVRDPGQAWKLDPRYCVTELVNNVHIYPAWSGDVGERAWRRADRITPVAVGCSPTHAHVFVLDLGDQSAEAYDIQVTFGNRLPLQFRVGFHRDDNVVGIEAVVPPASL
jgi:hypothetical protein